MGNTHLNDTLLQLHLGEPSSQDTRPHIYKRQLLVLLFLIRVSIPLSLRALSDPLHSLSPPPPSPAQVVRHILDDPEDLTDGRQVRIALPIFVVVQARLAHFHEPQRFVDVAVLDDICEPEPREGLGETQDAEERTRRGVRVGFLVLFVVLGDFAQADVGFNDVVGDVWWDGGSLLACAGDVMSAEEVGSDYLSGPLACGCYLPDKQRVDGFVLQLWRLVMHVHVGNVGSQPFIVIP